MIKIPNWLKKYFVKTPEEWNISIKKFIIYATSTFFICGFLFGIGCKYFDLANISWVIWIINFLSKFLLDTHWLEVELFFCAVGLAYGYHQKKKSLYVFSRAWLVKCFIFPSLVPAFAIAASLWVLEFRKLWSAMFLIYFLLLFFAFLSYFQFPRNPFKNDDEISDKTKLP